MPARKGKIATLPAKIREEINRRLHDGQQGPQIIPWLNSQEEVLRVLDERWGEEPITPQNLSEWRQGGYQDWLARRDREDSIKTLSEFSYKIAKASGGSLTEGAIAIAGGRILELLEKVADGEKPDNLVALKNEDGSYELPFEFDLEKLINSLATLRGREIDQQRTKQRDVVLEQRNRQLALEETKFRRQTAELFLKWYEDKRAKEIVESKGAKETKMEDLVQLMFGAQPEAEPNEE